MICLWPGCREQVPHDDGPMCFEHWWTFISAGAPDQFLEVMLGLMEAKREEV